MISYGRRFARFAGGFLCLVTLLSLVQILPVHGKKINKIDKIYLSENGLFIGL